MNQLLTFQQIKIYFPKISNEKLYHLSKKTLNNSYGIKEPDDDKK